MPEDIDQLMLPVTAPLSEEELLRRCELITGKTVAQLAQQYNLPVPADLRRHKGWLGNLLERILGADAGNQAEPDFVALGIELKTIPLNSKGEPKESTYVCTVNPRAVAETHWQTCWLRRKLSKVLWLPLEAENSIPLEERYIGQAILWQPSEHQETVLHQDWEELMEIMIAEGGVTARLGRYLQIRPKAAHSRVTTRQVGHDGEVELHHPCGFYLRTSFTQQILSGKACC
ncbi:MAG: DNA mismatch repair endonuclease MutH [Methylophaga sp.]|jgi:DNA mismatch repair protein MutH|nr:DNA mismatch repair endonuclease MutH [Methylophaga sp.]MAY16705.1 DNA mismatch repair endonuclease MutH [Methylophaga sp.]MBN46665.1 DNA mismatch repair endonuclease MutH [Methylophaga sp.]HAO26399.1 DNA mismatch repair endonuclease MutH [Methylophaga sp.]HCD05568.1 DNA mismatch repair endonuclease MutH [Methylophaga sp.]|tara:strand:- start:4856 stop:5548 length:693 start_codon:yes stop_codon:yes gene_type:complete